MRIIYAGTPEFAVPALEQLVASRHRVIAVFTQPDRPAGRGRKLQVSPVKAIAIQQQIPVYQPVSFKDPQNIEQLASLDADLMVVAAYGLILPQAVLTAPRLGCINIHASLLPRWRGAAPIQRAILAGDSETGITLMQMNEGLDTGGMLAAARLPLDSEINAAELHDQLKELGAKLLLSQLDAIEQSNLIPQLQDDAQACYAGKLTKQEALIDWYKDAELLHREVRAFNPWPVSYTTLNGTLVKIWSVRHSIDSVECEPGKVLSHDRQGIRVCCGAGTLEIKELQFAGKNRAMAAQLLNSRNLTNEFFGG